MKAQFDMWLGSLQYCTVVQYSSTVQKKRRTVQLTGGKEEPRFVIFKSTKTQRHLQIGDALQVWQTLSGAGVATKG